MANKFLGICDLLELLRFSSKLILGTILVVTDVCCLVCAVQKNQKSHFVINKNEMVSPVCFDTFSLASRCLSFICVFTMLHSGLNERMNFTCHLTGATTCNQETRIGGGERLKQKFE